MNWQVELKAAEEHAYVGLEVNHLQNVTSLLDLSVNVTRHLVPMMKLTGVRQWYGVRLWCLWFRFSSTSLFVLAITINLYCLLFLLPLVFSRHFRLEEMILVKVTRFVDLVLEEYGGREASYAAVIDIDWESKTAILGRGRVLQWPGRFHRG
jgi:hypothetical protein